MLLRGTLRLVAMLALVFAGQRAAAQATPTAEQIQILQQMTPEQRAAVLEALSNPTTPALPSQTQTLPLPATTPAAAPPIVPPFPTALIPGDLIIQGSGTIVIEAAMRPGLEEDAGAAFNLDVNRTRLLGRRSYTLDKDGVLMLPGLAAIPLAGLTAEQAAVRLESEPLLGPLDISVTILPLTPIGSAALKPFGYSMFEARPDLFPTAPWTSVPVPKDYLLGPGDTLSIQFYGNENYQVELLVNTDGTISLPKLGPQPVAGSTFAEARIAIERRVAAQLIGTQVSITMGRLRAVRVFVVGDVKRPGAYDLSSLSRITNALVAAGGITEVGSLRRIALRRSGTTVRTLDLYALLLNGDTRNDAQISDGDVVLVLPVGAMAGIDGEVKRPALYELGKEAKLEDLMALAGGLQPTADRRRIQLERISSDGARRLETIDLTNPSAEAVALRAGDMVSVPPVLADVEDAIVVEGNASRPGAYQWFPGMTLTDLLPSGQSLKPRADLAYVLIRREVGPGRRTAVLSADLGAAQTTRHSPADIALQPRDTVTVFELGVARSAAIESVLGELSAQASRDEPLQRVSVAGAVRAPGSYPLEAGMHVSDLLRAGGGLAPNAHPEQAELTRFFVNDQGVRVTRLIAVDPARARSGDEAANIALEPYDMLNVKSVPDWAEQVSIEVRGEVRFPGIYTVQRGETLSSVVTRAGGLTDLAFPEGSVFTREFLREREAQQIEVLARRLESDIASLAIQRAQQAGGQADEALSVGKSLLQQLRSTVPTGRLVIDLPRVLANPGDMTRDITVRNGDLLMVPMRSEEVTVLGEVQYATSHHHDPALGRDDYIEQSGDLTPRADPDRVYVVRANGTVVSGGSSLWFREDAEIRPGDSIVVPLDTERLPQLAQWAAITQIIYNLAIAVAAVNSF